MTPKQYIEFTAKSDNADYSPVVARVDGEVAKLTHYALGLGTETAEVQDILKKHLAYGKDVDANHLKEELGDLMWYLARICDQFGFTLEDVMETNIRKLQARYGEKLNFTETAALNRDTSKEKDAMAFESSLVVDMNPPQVVRDHFAGKRK